MRNLELLELSRLRPANESFLNASHVVFLNNYAYVLEDRNLIVYDASIEQVLHKFEDLFDDCVTTPTCFQVENAVCFGTGTEFICVKDFQVFRFTAEGPFDAASWSPSQPVIAVAFESGELGLFHANFADDEFTMMPIEFTMLHDDDKDDCPKLGFVDVGWGTSETQFRGANARLAKNVQEEKEVGIELGDNSRTAISWRGNSEMFVVNYKHEGDRRLKVFQFEPCEMIYASPKIIGLQRVTAWNPEGNRIAAIIWTNQRCELAIFEKNCLFKSSFSLQRKDFVNDLQWSPFGDLIAVSQIDCSEQTYHHTIDLYMMKNYTWYLKQRLDFSSENPLVSFEFLPSIETTFRLKAVTHKDSLTYNFKLSVACSAVSYNDEGLICASINGSNVGLTRCKYGVIPPPFAGFTQKFNKAINFVLFHPTQPMVAIVDSSNHVQIMEIRENCLNLISEIELVLTGQANIPLQFHHFVWKVNENKSSLICFGEVEQSYVLIEFDESGQSICEWWSETKSSSYLDYLSSRKEMLVEIHRSICIKDKESDVKLVTLEKPPLFIKSVEIDTKIWVFSLNFNNKFYVNEIEVMQGIYSFVVHEDCLLLTTYAHKLMGVRLNESKYLEEFVRQDFSNVQLREIEIGSYLLFGIPKTSLVVMQLPRGNLETISAHIISLDKVESLVQQEKWDLAVDLVRTAKLNYNILVDLDVDRFIAGIPKFVESVKNSSLIGSFLLCLNDQNSINTIYKNCYVKETREIPMKCHQIAEKFIEYLQKINYAYYATTIIIACFVKDPTSSSSITEALGHIRNFLFSDQIFLAEKALETIQILKPDSDLFELALKTSDLNLAHFIGRRSPKMDPKEYDALISRLESYGPAERAFHINHHVKNYQGAIKFLTLYSKDISNILTYIEEHEVYKSAFTACTKLNEKNSDNFFSQLLVNVGSLYAKHLSSKNLHCEAASIYERVGLLENANEEYILAHAWEDSQNVASRVVKHMPTYWQELISKQISSGDIVEAANIYERCVGDEESAIVLLTKNNLFPEAIRMMKKCKRNDIYETHIFPGLKLYANNLTHKFSDMREKFEKNTQRLLTLRTEKKERARHGHDNQWQSMLGQGITNGIANFDDDVVSMADTNASTVRSTSSRTSTMSSRNRRKMERKKADTRQGSLYEDIALMKELHVLISEAFGLSNLMRDLCLCVVSCSHMYAEESYQMMEHLHNLLIAVQRDMSHAIAEIWPANINNLKAMEDPDAPVVYANLEFLDMLYRFPPQNVSLSWELNLFKG